MNAPVQGQDDLLPGEAEATQALIDQLSAMMARDRHGDRMHRDVHIKMHGLMRAEFTVLPDLPPELRVGLFAEPRTYRAWVRFSNSANAIKADGSPDIRGMAIKLMGVPGRKLVDDEPEAPTHDLILISSPTFPTRDARDFHGLSAAVIGDLVDKLVYFTTHPRVTWALLTSFRRHANPLQIRYYSAVPYAFGRGVVGAETIRRGGGRGESLHRGRGIARQARRVCCLGRHFHPHRPKRAPPVAGVEAWTTQAIPPRHSAHLAGRNANYRTSQHGTVRHLPARRS